MSSINVMLALTLCFVIIVFAGYTCVGDKIKNFFGSAKDNIAERTINLANIIMMEKIGIQEYAVAQRDYIIEKNQITKRNLYITDLVTRKFICDFHYSVKYGYDLSYLTFNDITQDDENKTVQIKLPKGLLISNELMSTNVRHNEGIIFSINKVKAEEMDSIQNEAKMEVAKRASEDIGLIRLAEEQIKLGLERIVRGVAPDYSVILVRD